MKGVDGDWMIVDVSTIHTLVIDTMSRKVWILSGFADVSVRYQIRGEQKDLF